MANTKNKQIPSSTKVTWTLDHRKKLDDLVNLLSTNSVMAYPDFEQPFALHTDAWNEGLGTILYPRQADGKMRVIAYGSRTLSPAEKNYHMHSGKLEFLALKWAVTERFRDILYYAPSFTVYSDNNPLCYMLTSARLDAARMRCVAELSDINFKIKCRPGKANADADGLSRMALDIDQVMNICTKAMSPEVIGSVMAAQCVQTRDEATWITAMCTNPDCFPPELPTSIQRIASKELVSAQENDLEIGKFLRAKMEGQQPQRQRGDHWGLHREWRNLVTKEGVLY